jgi:hypothetical protein
MQRGKLTSELLSRGTVRSPGWHIFGDQPLLVMPVHLWHRRTPGYPQPPQPSHLGQHLPGFSSLGHHGAAIT